MNKFEIHWHHIVFWLVIPFVLAWVRLLSIPQNGVFAPIPLAFNFAMILLGWVVLHLSTGATVRFLLPSTWRDKRTSIKHGIFALGIGSLVGSALLFPTRPLRAELFCLVSLDVASECHPLGLSTLSWNDSSDFWRLAALNLLYWVLANQLVAWMFNVPRYGFALNRTGFAAASHSDGQNDFVSPLLSKLPLELGNDPILLVANEHYLDVHTRKGNTLVLYRLSDAVKELGDRGVRIHRSFWVAYDAICGFEKRGSALHVVLENGMTAPVSRGNRHLFNTERFQRMQLRQGAS